MNNGWFILGAFVASFLLTAVLRKYAIAKSLLDTPNQRSSHSVPTPRGGGVAIVIVFVFSLLFLYTDNALSFNTLMAALGSGMIVAVIGFVDDHGHVDARLRLLAHAFAAVWLLAWFGGFPSIKIWGVFFDLGWVGNIFAVLYLVWLLNLYNFMDGIDGIASVEAITVCLSACVLYWINGGGHVFWWEPLFLSAAVAGFLLWNAPPARIFMGDAGSGFLGMMLGFLSIQAAYIDSGFFWAWLIILGVFIVDATFTLIRRLFRGDKVHEAHRSHAYQVASRRFNSHSVVTISTGLLNILWLLPVAVCVVYLKLDGLLGLVIAYVPLVLIAWKFDAGHPENR